MLSTELGISKTTTINSRPAAYEEVSPPLLQTHLNNPFQRSWLLANFARKNTGHDIHIDAASSFGQYESDAASDIEGS